MRAVMSFDAVPMYRLSSDLQHPRSGERSAAMVEAAGRFGVSGPCSRAGRRRRRRAAAPGHPADIVVMAGVGAVQREGRELPPAARRVPDLQLAPGGHRQEVAVRRELQVPHFLLCVVRGVR